MLHVVFLRSAGALWRDELQSVDVALSPSIVRNLHFDSFTILWPLLLRGFLALSAPIRVLGFAMGLAALAAVWVAARMMGSRAPVIALAIAGCTVSVIRSGDEIRGYGLGLVSGVMAMAFIGRPIERRNLVPATLAAIIAVQCSYYNAVLVFACCIAAAVSGARAVHGAVPRMRAASAPLLVGFCAALTMLPYILVFRRRNGWDVLERFDIDAATFAERALQASGWVLPLVLGLAFLVAWRKRTLGYPAIAILLFVVCHFLFLRTVGFFPQPWYYAILIVAAAIAADVLLDIAPKWRITIAVIVASLAMVRGARDLTLRLTNADRAAALVERNGSRDDLVIVYPWTCGTSFGTYYRGVTPWQTLPPLAGHEPQRYDLAHALLNDTRGAEGLAREASQRLAAGHHVWLVGFPLYSDRAAFADRNRLNVVERADALWCAPLDRALRGRGHRLMLPPPDDTWLYERLQVVVF